MMYRVKHCLEQSTDTAYATPDGGDLAADAIERFKADEAGLWETIIQQANQQAGRYVHHYITEEFVDNAEQPSQHVTLGTRTIWLVIVMEDGRWNTSTLNRNDGA